MAYKSKYKPKFPQKYETDPTNIICRSNWERCVCKFLDMNPQVVSWSSESVVVPYFDKTTQQWRRYFPDFKIKTITGDILLVEVKPKKETVEPVKPARKSARYLKAILTWGKNCSKWAAAEEYASDRSWKFQIWDETILTKKLGLKITIR